MKLPSASAESGPTQGSQVSRFFLSPGRCSDLEASLEKPTWVLEFGTWQVASCCLVVSRGAEWQSLEISVTFDGGAEGFCWKGYLYLCGQCHQAGGTSFAPHLAA